MIAPTLTMTIPLRTDADGVIHIGDTRVTLDVLIARYHQGDTPELIHEGFPTISVTDIYAVIAYYLANRAELDAYLKHRDEAGERLRQEIEANYSPSQLAFTERLRVLAEQKRSTTTEDE